MLEFAVALSVELHRLCAPRYRRNVANSCHGQPRAVNHTVPQIMQREVLRYVQDLHDDAQTLILSMRPPQF